MKRVLFNDAWTVTELKMKDGLLLPVSQKDVTLPYDAMHVTKRHKDAPLAAASYLPRKWEYRKTFMVPQEWQEKTVGFYFEGVY